jgi:hypothetical protein
VPDGTTAMVRCPACKTVFSPAAGLAPPEPEVDEEDTEEEEKPRRKRKPAREEEEEDEKPRKKKPAKEENRDFDPMTEEDVKRAKKMRRRRDHDSLTPEEREARRQAFGRAAWGVKLIGASFAFFILSMTMVILFFFQFAYAKFIQPKAVYIIFAGVFGLINWTCAAVGVGLCLSGPRAPGHWGYGISAAVATVVHAVFLTVLVIQGTEFSAGQTGNDVVSEDIERWGLLPTRIDATMFYLTVIVYSKEEGFTPKGRMVVSMVTGVLEMVRTVLIMMLLSCLARAALDEDLAHKCTRAAGIASFGPGIVALVMFVFVATLIETKAGLNLFTLILLVTVHMGVYSILSGVIFPSFMTAREVADACDEPFQSQIPQL